MRCELPFASYADGTGVTTVGGRGPNGKGARPLLATVGTAADLQRTTAALAAKKQQGVSLGNRSNIGEAGDRGRQVARAAADHFATNLMPVIESLKASGITTLDALAQALNARGIRTARGGRWDVSRVMNLLRRQIC